MSDQSKGRPVCPGCGHSGIKHRTNGMHGESASGSEKWRCDKCGLRFNVPERKGETLGPRSGLAGRLADPSVNSVDDLESGG